MNNTLKNVARTRSTLVHPSHAFYRRLHVGDNMVDFVLEGHLAYRWPGSYNNVSAT